MKTIKAIIACLIAAAIFVVWRYPEPWWLFHELVHRFAVQTGNPPETLKVQFQKVLYDRPD